MSIPRILIVDDQRMNRELLCAYLEDSGFLLVEAENGERALEIARRDMPDLVLLDVMMPGMDGFETARRLKELAADTFLPIIVLTSLGDTASRLHALEAGADEFLTKPVERQELSLRIKNLLALREKDALLAERNVALGELNRFKDEMSALLVHDLKNPMSVILCVDEYLTDLLEGGDAAVLEALEDSRTAARQVMRLLENLLDLARVEAGRLELKRTTTRIAELLDQVVRARRMVATSRRITVRVEADPALEADLDPDLLARVLENIVDNSFRYTPATGRVDIRAHETDGSLRIELGNSGPAIPIDARTVIFEKFAQSTGTTGRTNLGLGLYFCRLAIEAHRGQIWVEETTDLPTVFVVQVPLRGS